MLLKSAPKNDIINTQDRIIKKSGFMMRDYLRSFFEEFEYEATDRVPFALAYERIIESTPARERFLSLIADYDRDTKSIVPEKIADIEFIAARSGVNILTATMLTVICLTRTLRARLTRLGLSKRIIALTLSDVKWKCDECKRLHGVVGTDHFDWYTRFFELRLFGVGRLQFEIRSYGGDKYEKDGKRINPGDPVLAVHIPNCGVKLEEKLCNAAYRDAKKLFTSLLGVKDIPFVCESWLLHPKNCEILSPKSNIVKFMSKFDIINTGNYRKDKNMAIPFLFDKKMGTEISELPERTSLQRVYKELLLNDGRMGWGFGVFFLEDAPKKVAVPTENI